MNFQRQLLVGTWFGETLSKSQELTTEYARINEDGSFEITFVRYNSQGREVEQIIELGDWGLVGDIHFTITKEEIFEQQHYAADCANPDNYHAYKVIQLNGQIFEYQHIVTNEVFNLRRVIDKIAQC